MEKKKKKLGDLELVTNEDMRGNLALMSPEEVIRVAAIDEALLSEASRYGDIFILVGGQEIFSSFFFWLELGDGWGLWLGKGGRGC